MKKEHESNEKTYDLGKWAMKQGRCDSEIQEIVFLNYSSILTYSQMLFFS